MKKKFAVTVSVIFMMVLLLPTIAWETLTVMNHFAPSIMEKLDYDLGEKRNKAKFPEQFEIGTYTAQLEAYYNDRVPFRSLAVSANMALDTCMEGIYKEKIRPVLLSMVYSETEESVSEAFVMDDSLETLLHGDSQPASPELQESSVAETLPEHEHQYTVVDTVEADYDTYGYDLVQCSRCHAEEKINFTEKLVDKSYFPPNIMNGSVLEGRRNWLYFAEDNSVEYYRGTNLLSEEELADYSARAAALQKLCDDKGIVLKLMIVPNKEQVYSEYMPSYEIKETYKRVERLKDYVKESSGIEIMYPKKELSVVKPYVQTYFKYDTHWNYAGAFIGAQVLNRSLGLPVTGLEEFNYMEIPYAGGDLCLLAGLSGEQYEDCMYFPNYKPEITVLSEEGDQNTIFSSVSDSPNQCNFVLIGDSYRICMIPYLQKDFSNILVANRDDLEDGKVQAAVKEADVLFVMAVERFDAPFMDSISHLESILSQ